MATKVKSYTVWDAWYDLLRQYGMTTVFGNPGSTEQPMLKNWPSDFEYILSLQEASVVGAADGYSQATRKPVLVSLHTSAGTGNAMGNIMTAFLNKTPLILVAGQQTREMLIGEPYLTNRQETTIPQPWVKWAYQPVRAEDVPQALIRAIAVAMQPPAGPVYLSIPLDDWDKEIMSIPSPRTVSTRIAPEPDVLADFAKRIQKSCKPVLVLGPEVDRSLAWDAAVTLAEILQAPVFAAPASERAMFPQNHPLFCGALPFARGPLSQQLEGFDLALVVGAEVFRYYPWVAGPVIPPGLELLQITNDAHVAATALAGDSLLSDARLALEGLISQLKNLAANEPSAGEGPVKDAPSVIESAHDESASAAEPTQLPMSQFTAFSILAPLRPSDMILVAETASTMGDLARAWPTTVPESYFAFASGGLGWAAPAATGIALAQKHAKTNRPVVLVIGDGSLHYSVQSIYTAVQHKLKLIYLVPLNEGYVVLQEFALLEKTPNVPALTVPGLNAKGVAEAYGCMALRAETPQDLKSCFTRALEGDGPCLIEFPVSRELKPLIASFSGKA